MMSYLYSQEKKLKLLLNKEEILGQDYDYMAQHIILPNYEENSYKNYTKEIKVLIFNRAIDEIKKHYNTLRIDLEKDIKDIYDKLNYIKNAFLAGKIKISNGQEKELGTAIRYRDTLIEEDKLFHHKYIDSIERDLNYADSLFEKYKMNYIYNDRKNIKVYNEIETLYKHIKNSINDFFIFSFNQTTAINTYNNHVDYINKFIIYKNFSKNDLIFESILNDTNSIECINKFIQ